MGCRFDSLMASSDRGKTMAEAITKPPAVPKEAITRARRSRIYFLLMNICLVADVLILASTLSFFERVVAEDGTVPTFYVVFGAVLIFFAFIVTPFLILARFMRDEYAEQLFRRTTLVLVYLGFAVPFFIFFAATIVYLVTRAPEAPWPFNLFMVEVTVWNAMSQPFKVFCLAFVFIFQFLRWRDSR